MTEDIERALVLLFLDVAGGVAGVASACKRQG